MNDESEEPQLTRRDLLFLIGATSGAWMMGSGCSTEESAPPEAPARPLSDLAETLRRHLSYLEIDRKVLEAFAHDFEQHRGRWSVKTHALPVTLFLASTDFFQNGADEKIPLQYATYYDPYLSPCYNPFSRASRSSV